MVVETETAPVSVAQLPELPKGWRCVRLGDVCQVNPQRAQILDRADDSPTTFVPMAAVDEQSGVIVRPEIRPFGEVRRGYTYFEEGDVLFAKITPCMQNGKHAVSQNLIGGFGFGTTEFHVVRPGTNALSAWVHQFLRQPAVLSAAAGKFTGAVGQQRVPDTFLENLSIPVPPITEQRRIVAVLTDQMAAVDRARAAAEAQLEAAEALPAAYLREVFDGEVARGWPRRSVGELCTNIDYGYTASADFEISEPRFLRITDIQLGNVDWKRVPGCRISSEDEKRKTLLHGDIVFARTGGTTGKSFLISHPPRAVFASYLIRLQPKPDIIPDFLYAFFQSDDYWRQVRASVRGGAQPNVNATLLADIKIPVAPWSYQNSVCAAIDEYLANVLMMRKTLQKQVVTIDSLWPTLLHDAFNGKL